MNQHPCKENEKDGTNKLMRIARVYSEHEDPEESLAIALIGSNGNPSIATCNNKRFPSDQICDDATARNGIGRDITVVSTPHKSARGSPAERSMCDLKPTQCHPADFQRSHTDSSLDRHTKGQTLTQRYRSVSYVRGFSFLFRNRASSETPATLTTLNRTPGRSPTE